MAASTSGVRTGQDATDHDAGADARCAEECRAAAECRASRRNVPTRWHWCRRHACRQRVAHRSDARCDSVRPRFVGDVERPRRRDVRPASGSARRDAARARRARPDRPRQLIASRGCAGGDDFLGPCVSRLVLAHAACPFALHLGESLHIDRRLFPLLLARQRLEQLDGVREIVVDRLARRREVDLPDLGECRFGSGGAVLE